MIQILPIDTVHFLCCFNKKKIGCINIMVAEIKHSYYSCYYPVFNITVTSFLLAPLLWNKRRRREVVGFTLRPPQYKIKYSPTPNILWIKNGVGTKIIPKLREEKNLNALDGIRKQAMQSVDPSNYVQQSPPDKPLPTFHGTRSFRIVCKVAGPWAWTWDKRIQSPFPQFYHFIFYFYTMYI